MSTFEIFTESSVDLPQEIIEQYNLQVMQLEVIIDDKEPVYNKDLDIKDFYEQLRRGANAKTAAVTPGYFEEHMRACLEAGKDLLYVGFSSGLSVTYNNGCMVLKELAEEFPDRKICYLDTLCASGGQGLMAFYAAKLREEGFSIEETAKKLEEKKDYIHHQVTVDDLFFLSKGGRLTTATAIAGSVLKVKPIIIMDAEGHLSNVGKVRGRKNALKELFDRFTKNENLKELNYVFMTHADCEEDVMKIADMIKAEHPTTEIVISDIGPVIGAHTGPGCIALCYLADEKR